MYLDRVVLWWNPPLKLLHVITQGNPGFTLGFQNLGYFLAKKRLQTCTTHFRMTKASCKLESWGIEEGKYKEEKEEKEQTCGGSTVSQWIVSSTENFFQW